MVLNEEISPKYMLLVPHLTISDDFSCPTSGACIENLMLKGDKLLILPDYMGYGVSKDRVHTYINHDLCTRNCIDALKAGYKVFRGRASVTMDKDWKLYVAGASQGGANSLAIHKWLDTHLDFVERWRLEYSYCGPYKPSLTFDKYFEQNVLTFPVVMPLTLKVTLADYPNILGKWKDENFYTETYRQHKAIIER